jgi:S-(hydroxymethyl)glutathione dehydrogenase / alcohol dehydrogenase
MKTKAAVLRELDSPLGIEEIEIDSPKANEVAIRVVATGICHSDLSVVQGIIRAPLPIVLGHEGAGVVEAVGPGVEGLRPGDHVIAALTPSCGECTMCSEGRPSLCIQMVATLTNCTMVDGTTRLRRGTEAVHQLCAVASFAEHAVIPAGAAIRVPDDVPLDVVCLIGCGVTTGAGAALNTAAVRPGSSVAVIGCGGVGLSIIQGSRIAGATTIIAIDPVAEKRELARSLGATHAIDPKSEDVLRTVRKITKLGVHYAFEAIGRLETIEQAWSLVRPTGDVIVVGMPSVTDEIKLRVGGLFQEKRITGSAYGSAVPHRDVPRFVDLYRKGDLRLDPMITRRIRLDEVNDALDALRRGEGARSVITFEPR